MTYKALFFFLLCSLVGSSIAVADEETRQVEEEPGNVIYFFATSK